MSNREGLRERCGRHEKDWEKWEVCIVWFDELVNRPIGCRRCTNWAEQSPTNWHNTSYYRRVHVTRSQNPKLAAIIKNGLGWPTRPKKNKKRFSQISNTTENQKVWAPLKEYHTFDIESWRQQVHPQAHIEPHHKASSSHHHVIIT